ncbi:hypothetical protein Sjap_024593 [Stephania japonica]|uniref:F-box domain-containing protein n=1 Tax=Stephania japonica TaxID=461633 RepID=A0AAP0EDN4_9MAGN
MAVSLPEELIEHVFSFLAAKDLIQTSILSKRWRSFWVSVPCTTLSFTIQNTHTYVYVLGWYDAAELAITCPDLESLILWDCDDLLCSRGLVLRTQNLKRLEVKHIVSNCNLELYTPKLSYFSYGYKNHIGECFSFEHWSLECWFGKVDAWDNADNTTDVPELQLQCTLNKLKYVAVQGVEGLDCELEFCILLLSGAVSLKRMVMIESTGKYFNHKKWVLKQFRKKLSEQFPCAGFPIQLL